MEDNFEEIAERVVFYKLRSTWLEVFKLYNEIAAEYDGTVSMAFVLLTIDSEEGTLSTKIAPRMGMGPNSLTRIIKSMEDRGLIFRQKDRFDKRQVFVHLTDEGRKMRSVAFAKMQHIEGKLFQDLGAEQLDGFFNVLNRIPAVVKTAIEEQEE